MNNSAIEINRLEIQLTLDSEKTKLERNKLGQFATPTDLADSVLSYSLSLLPPKTKIRFLDPAIGTGSFYSALLNNISKHDIDFAKGFEIDYHYAVPAIDLWGKFDLKIEIADFTHAQPPVQNEKYNLIVSNPPYVRHHHILGSEKLRLKQHVQRELGIKFSGLSGLYCYFLGITHAWMQKNAIACWLIPSEFMDVNYGEAIRTYLLQKVTLLRIHRFEPNDVQFNDALVSSAIVWFKNEVPCSDYYVEFSFGGSVEKPRIAKKVATGQLRHETKWTRYPNAEKRSLDIYPKLSDYFTIKRGLATGDNNYFILNEDEINELKLPEDVLRPILPSPKYLNTDEIKGDSKGNPMLDKKLFLLDCTEDIATIKNKFPSVWNYLEQGKSTVANGFLCRSRKAWYFQERRETPPLLCTYIGRTDGKNKRPFRFILNQSLAVATNSYLLLYPKDNLKAILKIRPKLLKAIWKELNQIPADVLLGEGRVYGGGMHKLEPKELANVNVSKLEKILSNEQ